MNENEKLKQAVELMEKLLVMLEEEYPWESDTINKAKEFLNENK